MNNRRDDVAIPLLDKYSIKKESFYILYQGIITFNQQLNKRISNVLKNVVQFIQNINNVVQNKAKL